MAGSKDNEANGSWNKSLTELGMIEVRESPQLHCVFPWVVGWMGDWEFGESASSEVRIGLSLAKTISQWVNVRW